MRAAYQNTSGNITKIFIATMVYGYMKDVPFQGVGGGAGHTALVTWALDILCGPESDTVLRVEGCQANEL